MTRLLFQARDGGMCWRCRWIHRTMFALWIEDTSFPWSLPFIFLEHFLKEMKDKEAIHFYLSLSYQIRSHTHIFAYMFTFLHAHTHFWDTPTPCKCTCAFMDLHLNVSTLAHTYQVFFFNILDIVLHKCRLTIWAKILVSLLRECHSYGSHF